MCLDALYKTCPGPGSTHAQADLPLYGKLYAELTQNISQSKRQEGSKCCAETWILNKRDDNDSTDVPTFTISSPDDDSQKGSHTSTPTTLSSLPTATPESGSFSLLLLNSKLTPPPQPTGNKQQTQQRLYTPTLLPSNTSQPRDDVT